MKTWIPGTIGALALATSLGAGTSTASAADSSPLDGTAWVLTGLPGRALIGNSVATLQFAQGQVSGSDGCNRFAGGYTVKDAVLGVSQLASTQMACAAEVMQQAQAYLAALTGAKSYRVKGQRLELLSADGKIRAILGAQSLLLVGTSWRATGINNGKQAVAGVAADSLVTMSFGAEGDASGSAGCNNYSANYKSEGSSLSFGPAATTRKMCAKPDGVMEQEQQFLSALATVTSARFEGDRLELRTADGALAISLVRRPGG